MLDRLIESNDHGGENKRRGGFLISTLMVVATIFMSGILWSLFAKDLAIGAGDFELSTIVAPVPAMNNEPETPPQIEKQSSISPKEITRRTDMARVDEAQFVPKDVSTIPNTDKSRPIGRFLVDKDGIDSESNAVSSSYKNGSGINGVGLGDKVGTSSPEDEEITKTSPPPPPVKKEAAKPPTELKRSLGVVNGMAISLIKPAYTAAAKAVRANGEVSVQVTIDEQGNIIAANAVSGHPLLRQVSEQAARASKFKPTLLSNQPVKATGIIIYKFAMQ